MDVTAWVSLSNLSAKSSLVAGEGKVGASTTSMPEQNFFFCLCPTESDKKITLLVPLVQHLLDEIVLPLLGNPEVLRSYWDTTIILKPVG